MYSNGFVDYLADSLQIRLTRFLIINAGFTPTSHIRRQALTFISKENFTMEVSFNRL